MLVKEVKAMIVPNKSLQVIIVQMVVSIKNTDLGCVQKCKLLACVLPWVPVPNDERQQEQVSKAKHSRVTCISKRSPV